MERTNTKARRMDTDQPLIGILHSAHQRGELEYDSYSPDDWARQLKDFALGYLDMEAQDRETDYDLTKLLGCWRIYEFPQRSCEKAGLMDEGRWLSPHIGN